MEISLENLSLKYHKRQILSDINFKIKNDEVISIIGPSGVGKTTLLKIIAGIEPNYDGRILYSSDIGIENIFLVFQDFWLFPHMTVQENISFGLRIKKCDKEIILKKTNELLDILALKDVANSYPDELSGGQKQRVALARAVILKPKLLLLDEPFSSLDANLREETKEYLLNLKQEYEFSILMVTHDKNEAFQMSDRIAILLDGKIEQFSSPEYLYFSPKNKQVADFLGESNYIPGFLTEDKFSFEEADFRCNNIENKEKIQGECILLIPYGTPFSFSDKGIPCKIEEIKWSLNGLIYYVYIGEVLCKLTNIQGEPKKEKIVFLQPLKKYMWKVMSK